LATNSFNKFEFFSVVKTKKNKNKKKQMSSVEHRNKRARLDGAPDDDVLIGTADSASLWNVTLSPGWTMYVLNC
jgi:hypothetical protein